MNEARSGEHKTDEHADGGAEQAQHQLYVGDEQADAQRHRHDAHRDAAERALGDRVVNYVVVVGRVHLLVQERVQASSTGEDDERETER